MFAGFPTDRLFLIAGPCVLEDEGLNLRVADALAKLARSSGRDRLQGVVRQGESIQSRRRARPGAGRRLAKLARVREVSGLPILTDVHLPDQCAPVAEVVDVLQIPAFLCRQTDLLEAAGATGRAVNIKKGQWMHPEGMKGAVSKVDGARPQRVNLQFNFPSPVSRLPSPASPPPSAAPFFGYGDLVVDMRAFARMRAATATPVIFDGTHSVQQPGKGEGGAAAGCASSSRRSRSPRSRPVPTASSSRPSRPRPGAERWPQHAPVR